MERVVILPLIQTVFLFVSALFSSWVPPLAAAQPLDFEMLLARQVLAVPGELSLMLLLLVMGVDAQRWREQAGAAAGRQ
jgi:hypothetical protein